MEKLSEIYKVQSENDVIFNIFNQIKVSMATLHVIWALPTLHGGSLEITLTVPLTIKDN